MTDRWIHFLTSTFPHPKTSVVAIASGTTSVWGMINQDQAVTIAFALVAFVSAVGPPAKNAVKWWYDFRRDRDDADRKARLAADTAEMDTWGKQIADANAEKGTALGQLKVALEQLESVKLQLRDVAVENKQLNAEIAKQRHRTNNLEHEVELHRKVAVKVNAKAVKAGQVAADNSSKVKDIGERVEAIEHVVASSSSQDFQSLPPAEPEAS